MIERRGPARPPFRIGLATLVERANAARDQGRWSEATAFAVLGLEAVLSRGAPSDEATPFLNVLGAVAFQQGRYDEAERRFLKCLAIARGTGDACKEAGALVNLGATANVRGRFRLAGQCYRRGRRAFHRGGAPRMEARALHNLGMLLADRKKWRRAAVCFRRARRLARGDDALVGLVDLNWAEVLTELGELEEALDICEEAHARLSAAGMQPGVADAHVRCGEILRRRDEPERAREHFRRALEQGRELEAPLTRAEALRGLGHVHADDRDHARALTSYARALELFRSIDAGHELADRVVVEIAELLGRDIEAHGAELHGHSTSVARLAVDIARELAMPLDELKGILVAGYLHDIGKLSVPAEILRKPGSLTLEERRTIELHAILGAEFVGNLGLPWDIAPGILGHHENWNGTGYPDRLAGHDIPLVARILRVADAFDSMTSDRVYRSAMSREDARAHIRENAGRLFDPAVAEAFERVVQRRAPAPVRETSISAVFARLAEPAVRAA